MTNNSLIEDIILLKMVYPTLMIISIFDLFKVGIGPSSSHTVGPMVAARLFVRGLTEVNRTDEAISIDKVARVKVALYGSLGATGKGHGSGKAVLLGLMGMKPETVDVDAIPDLMQSIRDTQKLALNEEKMITFNEESDLIFHRKETLPFHSNGMKIQAFDSDDNLIMEKIYYSVGNASKLRYNPMIML